MHDAFVKIIENLDKIQDIHCHTTKSFIVIIVRNHSINLYNNRNKKIYVAVDKERNRHDQKNENRSF